MQISFFDNISTWSKNSSLLKLMVIGILFLILLIPQSMVSSLIQEREHIRDEAIKEVSSKWGLEQMITPPVLNIPYRYTFKDEKGLLSEQIGYAHFLPESNHTKGALTPEKRYRGIYMVVLYNAVLKITGNFAYPNFDELDIPISDYLMDEAFISFGISDLKGLNEQVLFQLNEQQLFPNPGLNSKDLFESGLSCKVKLDPSKKSFNYQYNLNLNGSSAIDFKPYAKTNTVQLNSIWGSPSFEGGFLPTTHQINNHGFTSNWKVLHLNRNYPQQGKNDFIGENDESFFGVKLMLPIDEYHKITRSIKYCAMFILLTFLTFFFIEIINNRRIHSIQYLLVGFAIIIFYILLLSISEHLKFNLAYLLGSLATMSLLGFYAYFVFENKKLTFLFVGLLSLLYLFFYSLLQLEDYALLMGSIGLFVILSAIMYLTRKIDWYHIKKE